MPRRRPLAIIQTLCGAPGELVMLEGSVLWMPLVIAWGIFLALSSFCRRDSASRLVIIYTYIGCLALPLLLFTPYILSNLSTEPDYRILSVVGILVVLVGGVLASFIVCVFFPKVSTPYVTEESCFAATAGAATIYTPSVWNLPWGSMSGDDWIMAIPFLLPFLVLAGLVLREFMRPSPPVTGVKLLMASWYIGALALIALNDGAIMLNRISEHSGRPPSLALVFIFTLSAFVVLIGFFLAIVMLLEALNAEETAYQRIEESFCNSQLPPGKAIALTVGVVLTLAIGRAEGSALHESAYALGIIALQGYNFLARGRVSLLSSRAALGS